MTAASLRLPSAVGRRPHVPVAVDPESRAALRLRIALVGPEPRPGVGDAADVLPDLRFAPVEVGSRSQPQGAVPGAVVVLRSVDQEQPLGAGVLLGERAVALPDLGAPARPVLAGNRL